MEHDVFISHARKDKSIADAICEKLESARLRCWIPARDIPAGEDWTEATRNAIGSSRVMVLVLSENANAAHHIEREIAHAFYTRRIIIPFRVADTFPRRNFLFYIGNIPWLNAVSPPPEQHLEALAARIKGLVPDRTVTVPPRGATQTTATLNYPNSWIGALRASHYRTLGILKWVAIATSLFAVVLLLWFALRQTKEGVLLAQSNLRSTDRGSSVSPKSSPQAGGDALVSPPTYSFTRFGLWQAANASPTPLIQPGPQDTPLTTPADRSASLTPSPRSDVTAGQRAGLTSASESSHRPLTPPGMHQTPHHHHRQYRRTKAQQAQKNANVATSQLDALQRQLKETEAKVQKTQKYADLVASQRDALEHQLKEIEARAQMTQKNADLVASEHDSLRDQLKAAENRERTAQNNEELATSQRRALQNQLEETEAQARAPQKNADLPKGQRDVLETQLSEVKERAQIAETQANLAASQRGALKAELAKAEEKTQLAQHNADLAVSQRTVLEAQLRKAQEEKAQLAQEDANLAGSHHSAPNTQYQQEQEDVQPANEDADLAANQPESARTQPPNPGQNAKPVPLTQTLDSSVRSDRP
jgi:hypothetical protein